MSTQTLNGKVINNYPVFEGSQVLTSEQLNTLFEYLDQQHRYTRAKLIGIGIVCGMDIRTEGDVVITSEGMGITSDGFLIKMPPCEMRHRRDYRLPPGVFYRPFGSFDTDQVYSQDDDILLYELLAQEPEDGLSVPLESDFFEDKYLLIFLECFDRDPRSCLGKNCEDLGKERIFTTRKLAVNREGLEKILAKGDGVLENPYAAPSVLHNVVLRRPMFTPESRACEDYFHFTAAYKEAIKGAGDQDDVMAALFGNNDAQGLLYQTYEVYAPLLGSTYNYANPLADNSRFAELKAKLREIIGADDSAYVGIQYIYEYLCLLLMAYHEFVASAEHLSAACCPSKQFPLHLMLGKIQYDEEKEEDEIHLLGRSRYRHQFLQADIFNAQRHLAMRTISLHKRLLLMLESFRPGVINEPDMPIKVTPTRYGTNLADQSIPFYLDPTRAGSVNGIKTTNLETEWDVESSLTMGKSGRVYSYSKNEIAAGGSLPDPLEELNAPVLYDKNSDYYNLEGILNKAFEEVEEAETSLATRFHLPFQVIPVQFGNDSTGVVLAPHYWQDLQSDYQHIKTAFITTIRNLTGDLKAFHTQAIMWQYEFEYTNVWNFRKVVLEILEAINQSTGLVDEGERLIGKLTDTIEQLHDNGAPGNPFEDLYNYYKSLRKNLDKVLLKLRHASAILTNEKMEVLEARVYENWDKALCDIIDQVNEFQRNGQFHQLFNLYHRFVLRYNYLKQHHFSLFCNFIQLFPGVQQRPVERGGTHILLYELDELEEESGKKVKAALNLPYRLDPENIPIPIDPALASEKTPPLGRGEALLLVQGDASLIYANFNDLDANGDTLVIKRKGHTNADGVFEPRFSAQGVEVLFHEGEEAVLRYEPTDDVATGGDFFEYTVGNSEDSSLEDVAHVEVLLVDPYEKHVKATEDLAATDEYHSVFVDILTNDHVNEGTTIELDEISEFGATISLTEDNKVLYTPIPGRVGKDRFGYTIVHERDNNDTPEFERSRSYAEVIVFCCHKVGFEVICEGNVGEFDVMTDREKKEEAELVLIDATGDDVLSVETQHGTARIISTRGDGGETGFRSDAVITARNISRLGTSVIEYRPPLDFRGRDELIYEVTDSRGFKRRVKLHVLVVKCSDIRIERTLRDTVCDFSVLKEDQFDLQVFEDRSALRQELKTPHGNVEVIDEEGFSLLRYTPDTNYYGLDEFQFTYQDGEGVRHYSTVHMIVDGHEKVQVESTFQDTPVTFPVLTEKMTESGYRINVFQTKPDFKEEITTREGGQAAVRDHLIRYLPKTSFLGEDQFFYVILKDGKPFEYGTYYILVDTNRKVSVAYTLRDTVKDISLLTPLQAEQGASLEIVTAPGVKDATAEVKEGEDAIPLVQYTPAPGYVGQDSFGYVIELDETKLFGTVYVIVDSNERIELQTVLKGDATDMQLFEEEQTVNEFEITQLVQNGETRWFPDKNVLMYRPNADYVGHDKLKFKANFGNAIQYGTIFFIVTCNCEDVSVMGTVTDDANQLLGAVRVEEIGTDNFTLTESNGLYNLQVPGDARLRFSKRGYTTKEEDVDNRTTINAQLQRTRVTVTGTVTDPNNQPIRSARIASTITTTETNSRGEYSIVAYTDTTIDYSANGYRSATRIAPGIDREFDVVLEPEQIELNIRVFDETNSQTLVGVKVTNFGTQEIFFTEETTTTTVDADTGLNFDANGFFPRQISVADLTVDSNNRADLQLPLTPVEIQVSGTVRNEKGAPIVGASVAVRFSTRSALTNLQGQYSVNMPMRGALRASATGYLSSPDRFLIEDSSSPFLDARNTGIAANNTANMDFVLRLPGGELSGVVRDLRGNPLSGVAVRTTTSPVELTTPEGNFSVRVLEGETVIFEKTGYESQTITAGNLPSFVEITLQNQTFSINVRAIDRETRKPVVGARVSDSRNPSNNELTIASFIEMDLNFDSNLRIEAFGFNTIEIPAATITGGSSTGQYVAELERRSEKMTGRVFVPEPIQIQTRILVNNTTSVETRPDYSYEVNVRIYDITVAEAFRYGTSDSFRIIDPRASTIDLRTLNISPERELLHDFIIIRPIAINPDDPIDPFPIDPNPIDPKPIDDIPIGPNPIGPVGPGDNPVSVFSAVTGSVTAPNSEKPMANVEVVNLRTGESVKTAKDGTYKINAEKGDQLEFRSAKNKQTVSVESSTDMKVALGNTRKRK